jgi:hypothetical protein
MSLRRSWSVELTLSKVQKHGNFEDFSRKKLPLVKNFPKNRLIGNAGISLG